ncbi:poly-gamma-glutamate biosynthesis protein PgsC [Natronincola ferrireducens]|uniref:Poly-gamma-glutamate biosynthesis protein PgsC/CapC n=1 Tax=Natronincola ferrireducens TaxID=393762 RepID=A0A1G9FRF2_9FIRM|nr:poly-gamma-glutamate biosynthesis protein PgsC [Natronincola ferrireducens]SDK90984.1 poly-gamma-glutamate biosynthesis protein PgsC/CapC [Natronincola ferrireducens]
MLEVFIGIGIIISLTYYEITELSPGGMISPIYLALFIDQPKRIIGTIIISVIIYYLLKLLSNYIPIYGKRTFALAIVLGIILKLIFVQSLFLPYLAIGSIIPGLIAFECDKQGVLPTLFSLFITSIILKVMLILMQGSYFI